MNNYTRPEIDKGFLFSSDTDNKKKGSKQFALFVDHVKFFNWYDKCPEEAKTLYEVIPGQYPQKLKFDIDITEKDAGELFTVEYGENLKDRLIKRTIEVQAAEGWTIDLSKDIAIATSHRSDKFSYHITFNNHFYPDVATVKRLRDCIVDETFTKQEREAFIDPKTYSKLQNWRLLGSHKKGKSGSKTFCPRWEYFGQGIVHWTLKEKLAPRLANLQQFRDTLVRCYEGLDIVVNDFGKQAETLKTKNNQSSISIDDATIEEALGIFQKTPLAQDYKLRDVSGKYINLSRTTASMCCLCQRNHGERTSNGDGAYLTIASSGRIYFNCRRHTGKGQEIGVLEPEAIPEAEVKVPEPEPEVKAPEPAKPKKRAKDERWEPFKEPFFTDRDKDQKYVQPIKHVREDGIYRGFPIRTDITSAPMGSGKTNAYITDFDTQKYKTILIISPRVLFSHNLMGKLRDRGFKCYLDPKIPKTELHKVDRLVIQFESLKHLHVEELRIYDCVILDESESILKQTSSPTLSGWKTICEEVFAKVVAQCGFLGVFDAFISVRTERAIRAIRHPKIPDISLNIKDKHKWAAAAFKKREAFIKNGLCTRKYMLPPKGRKGYHFKSQDLFVNELLIMLEAKQKILSVYGSKNKMKQHLEIVTRDMNWQVGREILCYDSDTGDDEKKQLAEVKEVWSQPQVRWVCYTSTITVGVDYDVQGEGWFDFLFVYASCMGSIVRDVIQGTMRARHLRTNAVCFYITSKYGGADSQTLKLNYDEVRESLISRIRTIRHYDERKGLNHRDWDYTDSSLFDGGETPPDGWKVDDTMTTIAKGIGDPEEYFQSWAFENDVRNILEDNLSKLCHADILLDYFHYLKYEIETFDGKDDDAAGGGIIDYWAIEKIDEETRALLEYRKKTSCLDKQGRLELDKYYFDKIYNSDDMEDGNPWPTIYFNHWRKKSQLQLFDNIKAEKRQLQDIELHTRDCKAGVPFLSENQAPKLWYMTRLMNLLGMEHSCQRVTISHEVLWYVYENIKEEIPAIQTIFQFKPPKKGVSDWRRETYYLLKGMFLVWSGNKVLRGKRQRKRENGKMIDITPIEIQGVWLYDRIR